MTWATIVFMQGEDADAALSILDENGPGAAVEYLHQWDHGERDDTRPEAPWGSEDRTHTINDGPYQTVLAWNWHLQYIGLHQRAQCQWCWRYVDMPLCVTTIEDYTSPDLCHSCTDAVMAGARKAKDLSS